MGVYTGHTGVVQTNIVMSHQILDEWLYATVNIVFKQSLAENKIVSGCHGM